MRNYDLGAVNAYPAIWHEFKTSNAVNEVEHSLREKSSHMMLDWFMVFNAFMSDKATMQEMLNALGIMYSSILSATQNQSLADETVQSVINFLEQKRRQTIPGLNTTEHAYNVFNIDGTPFTFQDRNPETPHPAIRPRPPGQ